MWFENYVRCDLKLMFITIPMHFFTIAKIIWCCDKLWFLGVSIAPRRDLQMSIVICLNLAIYCESWWYTLQTYLCMDSVQTIKKDGFPRLIVFTIVKITSTDKEIMGTRHSLCITRFLHIPRHTLYNHRLTWRNRRLPSPTRINSFLHLWFCLWVSKG